MSNKRLIYLATPYTHKDQATMTYRYTRACTIAALLIERGEMVFSPIAHSHSIAKMTAKVGYEHWKEFDELMMRVCDVLVVVVMEGWKESKGIAAEVEYMKSLGKPVEYIDYSYWTGIRLLEGRPT